MKRLPIAGIAAGVLLLTGACAGSVPNEQLARSQAALSAAEAVDGQYPQAALHLRMARDQIQAAEDLIQDREYGQADRLLQRAQADAELAHVLARQGRMEEMALRARREVAQLRTQLEGGEDR